LPPKAFEAHHSLHHVDILDFFTQHIVLDNRKDRDGIFNESETVHNQIYTGLGDEYENIQLTEGGRGGSGRAFDREMGIGFGSEWIQMRERNPASGVR
jgi:hypothetical protein